MISLYYSYQCALFWTFAIATNRASVNQLFKGTTQGFWGTGEHDNFDRGNRVKNSREQGNIYPHCGALFKYWIEQKILPKQNTTSLYCSLYSIRYSIAITKQTEQIFKFSTLFLLLLLIMLIAMQLFETITRNRIF